MVFLFALKKTFLFFIDKTFQSVFGDGYSLKELPFKDKVLQSVSPYRQSQLLLNYNKIGSFSVSVKAH